MRKTAVVAKDLGDLLANLPEGAWVAVSHDEDRVIAHGPELNEVLQRAKAAGEEDPIVVRVPPVGAIALF